MINSLFSQNSYAFAARPQQSPQISSAQSESLKNILSNFDANNISETDARNIVDKVKEVSVKPGQPLVLIFANEGFDAKSIGQKAGAEGQRPPPPGGGKGGPKGEINTEALSALTQLLEAKDGEEVTETEWNDFYTGLENQGVDTSKPFIDLKL